MSYQGLKMTFSAMGKRTMIPMMTMHDHLSLALFLSVYPTESLNIMDLQDPKCFMGSLTLLSPLRQMISLRLRSIMKLSLHVCKAPIDNSITRTNKKRMNIYGSDSPNISIETKSIKRHMRRIMKRALNAIVSLTEVKWVVINIENLLTILPTLVRMDPNHL